jgi:hypothetical protein
VAIGCVVALTSVGPGDEAPAPVPTIQAGHAYMVYVSHMEVYPRMPDGADWDSVDGSAPDLFYEVWWQGNRIYSSDTRLDGLMAQWIPVGVNLKESILNGTISADQALRVPLMAFTAGATETEQIIIKVYDADPFPVSDDDVAVVQVALPSLHLGNNEMRFATDAGHGLRALRIRVVDNELPLAQKVAELMKP